MNKKKMMKIKVVTENFNHTFKGNSEIGEHEHIFDVDESVFSDLIIFDDEDSDYFEFDDYEILDTIFSFGENKKKLESLLIDFYEHQNESYYNMLIRIKEVSFDYKDKRIDLNMRELYARIDDYGWFFEDGVLTETS